MFVPKVFGDYKKKCKDKKKKKKKMKKKKKKTRKRSKRANTICSTSANSISATGRSRICRRVSSFLFSGSQNCVRAFCRDTNRTHMWLNPGVILKAETDFGQTDFGHPYFPTLAKPTLARKI